jgi:hypothetical protein
MASAGVVAQEASSITKWKFELERKASVRKGRKAGSKNKPLIRHFSVSPDR